MNIQSISIVPEDVGCNQKCKFCIARMTPRPEKAGLSSWEYLRKLEGALMWAKAGNAQTAIITSKGETLLADKDFLLEIISLSRKYFGQIDLHTNGALLTPEIAKEFYDRGLTNVTLSVPSLKREELLEITEKFVDYGKIIRFLDDIGLVVRLSAVVNKKGVRDLESMMAYISEARKLGARQIVFRELWVPENSRETNSEVYNWSVENAISLDRFRRFIKDLKAQGTAKYIFTLPWGEEVLDVEGINITSATCTVNYYGNGNKGSDNQSTTIKSVIFLPDGHLYSSWEFKGSIIM